MNKHLAAASLLACLVSSHGSASAQEPATTPYLVGRVSPDGARLQVETAEGERSLELMVTEQQAGEVPRRVDLRRYRGRHVIVLCQPWYGSEERVWGCEGIGRLVATKALPRR